MDFSPTDPNADGLEFPKRFDPPPDGAPPDDPNADGLEFPKRFDPPRDGALELDDSPNGFIFAFSGSSSRLRVS